MNRHKLMLGDNIESLKKLPDNSIDSVVTDPPYGLSFMNKKWDYEVPSVDFWKEVYRVLKPGGHILSFGGTRTYHRMVVNIEDAGFEIRDQIMWLYGSGFPKSHNIGKAVDKIEGNEREVVGVKENCASFNDERIKEQGSFMGHITDRDRIDLPVTKGTSPFEGWGTALKPANEPICLARKPLSEKSVAENVLKWKTGGINVDGCRVGSESISSGKSKVIGGGQLNGQNTRIDIEETFTEGRFPANILLECICDEVIKGEKGEVKSNTREAGNSFNNYDENKGKVVTRIENYGDKGDIHTNPMCPCRLLDEQSGVLKGDSPNRKPRKGGHREEYVGTDNNIVKNQIISDKIFSDKGGASRFFYQAKVSKAERNMGLDHFEEKVIQGRDAGQDERNVAYKTRISPRKNTHPTVKPINLMTYLCRLITPENGIVLDPFMGSGSTGIAAQLEGFRFCGMEMDPDYFKIAEARINSFEKYRKFIK